MLKWKPEDSADHKYAARYAEWLRMASLDYFGITLTCRRSLRLGTQPAVRGPTGHLSRRRVAA